MMDNQQNTRASIDMHAGSSSMVVEAKKETITTWTKLLLANPAVEYMLLAGVVVVALFIRLFQLGEWSMWGDEVITVNRSLNLFNQQVLPSTSLILTKVVLETWGVNDFNARLASALLGVISIPLLFFPIRKIMGRDIAFVAMLFLALSPWHLYWSQNARFYTALFLFFNLGILLFHLAMEKDSLPTLFLAMFFMGLAALERLIAFYIVPVIAGYIILVWLMRYKQPDGMRWRNLMFLILPGLIGAVMIAPRFIREITGFFQSYNTLAINSPIWILAGAVKYIGIPTVIMGLAGLFYLLKQKRREGLILGLGAIVPSIGTILISVFGYTANRYIFVALLCWILLASFALVELVKQSKGATRWLAVSPILIVLIVYLGDNGLYYFYNHGNRTDWKSAQAYVQQNMQEGDLLYSSSPRVNEYYLGVRVKPYRLLDLQAMENNQQRVWIFEDVSGVTYWPIVHASLLEKAKLMEVFDVNVEARSFRMRVYLYDPQAP